MKLIYQSGQELVCLDIDRNNKKLKTFSSLTGYKFVEHQWKMLFDKGKEEAQDKQTENLSDSDFEKIVTIKMEYAGYKKQNLNDLK